MTFVFAGLMLLSRSAYAADLCGTPDFAQAVDGAEVIFSGKITKIERAQTRATAVGEYVVTFKVETSWKGTPSHEMRVLLRSTVMTCPFLPVGEVGEDYLVYADPSEDNTKRDQLPEVTIFNRTGKLPATLKSESVVIKDWNKQPLISPRPILNRADASDDVELLLALRECGCLSITHLPPPLDSPRLTSLGANSGEREGMSACQTCLRRTLKPF